MTDQASTSATERRTRRQLLARGTGALAAVFAAGAVARPAPAFADNGGSVILGQANTETATTKITNSADNKDALECIGTGDGSGVTGRSDRGPGVAGISGSDSGVFGFSGIGNGVSGASNASGNGVFGLSGSGNGVSGLSNTADGVHGEGLIGVHGVGFGGRTGVQGTSGSGAGVAGFSSSGTAVFGLTSSASASSVSGENLGAGPGVSGFSAKGTGVKASGKTALRVQGPAKFSRSGILTVAAGHSSAKKTGIALAPASFVLATIQDNVAGVHVQGVTLLPGSHGSFTIHLNKTVSESVKVAWFAVN